MVTYNPADPNSFSHPELVKVTGVHFDWTLDFTAKVVDGSVLLTVDRVDKAATHLVLDSRELSITSVCDNDSGEKLNYDVGDPHAKFGSPVTVTLPAGPAKQFHILIKYMTSPKKCTALQWLTPEQTAGKTHPYVFSQCQAIHCRSLAPVQDTPGVKCPYTATVRVPEEITPLMSAILQGVDIAGGVKTCRFSQSIPVPSYLVAVVAGRIEGRSVGPRSTVWSEPSVVEKAEYEFAETEQMLLVAEELCGTYVWGRYDLVVLPPSFPYGGMENPCLTFVTPTVLAGDRSCVDVVTHEITHSWTGNLVTSCKWADFWLNEGFTMFIERKITGRRRGQAARHFAASGGWKNLQDCISNAFPPGSPLTALVPCLTEVDPDDAFSSVPYEKGHTLLWFLEELLGGASVFEPFLRAYIEKFAHKSIATADFHDFLFEFFPEQRKKLEAVDWESWWHKPGMPDYTPKFDDSMSLLGDELFTVWDAWTEGAPHHFSADDIKEMNCQQICEFLEKIYLAEEAWPAYKMEKMGEVYSLWDTSNCEIRFRWLRACLRARVEASVAPTLKFVTDQGRMKYVRPLYRELYRWAGTVRQKAVAHFLCVEASMMHVAAHGVKHELKLLYGQVDELG